MILIEYFDKSPLENISSCLNLQPDKINPDNIIGFLAPFGIYTAKITVPFLAVYCFQTAVRAVPMRV